jgi:hypothetical protein
MHYSKANKFIFVGGRKMVDHTKAIVKYRINEESAKPLWMVTNDDDCPGLLKSICNQIAAADNLTNETIEELSKETTVELGEIGAGAQSGMDSVGSTTTLKPGSDAALLLDNLGAGMFVPSSRTLFVKQNDRLEEIELEEARSSGALKNAVLGKEILVNNQGLYVSIRPIFLRLMSKNGRNVNFIAGAFQWKGFDSLYGDATYWNRVLEEAVKRISAREPVSFDNASMRLAERLSKLGLNARDPEYMKTWWTDYDDVPIDDHTVRRLYSVDHPKGSTDMRLIFNDLRGFLPDFKLDDLDAERTYTAAVKMQNLRRAVFKREGSTFRYLRPLFSTMEKEITSVVSRYPTFRVGSAYLVRVNSTINAFKRLDGEELRKLTDSASFTIL